MTDARRPYHVGVFLGLSAGTYAALLAAVTGIQSGADAALAAARQPGFDVAARLAGQHDQLEAKLAAAADAYAAAARQYDRLGSSLGDLEGRLGALATVVASVEGASRALPARVALPSVSSVSRTVVRVTAPAVHATTGASGG